MIQSRVFMLNILTVNKLQKSFGKLIAVYDLSFQVKGGEVLGIIGPNGAGKTTLFNLLMGNLKPDQGEIIFQGKDITRESPANRSHLGLGRTFQIPRPFDKMTVFENLLAAALHGGGKNRDSAYEEVHDILGLIGLSSHQDRLAGGLSLLDRKRLELGRALATDPRLILLDEVAGGLTELEAALVLEIVTAMQKRGITIIWIEHLMAMMSEGVDRLLAIAGGRHLICGDPKDVMDSKEVLECYMGTEEEE
jgi:branched-chain amino acid transport system ATP-binding protein